MSYNILEFKPNTFLLNYQFEGYKLRLVDYDGSARDAPVQIHELESTPATPTKLAASTLLTFDETYARVHFNHLFVGPTVGSFIYVDSSNTVNLVDINNKEKPQTNPIFNIPVHPKQCALPGYPSLHALATDTILVFDGLSTVYVLRQTSTRAWIPLGLFEIGLGSIAAGPSDQTELKRLYFVIGASLVKSAHQSVVRLHYCHRADRNSRRGSMQQDSAMHSQSDKTNVLSGSKRNLPMYCIQGIQVQLPLSDDEIETEVQTHTAANVPTVPPLASNIAHTLHSQAIPLYCEHMADNRFVLGVRNGVSLDNTETISQMPPPAIGIPDLYYWTQTSSDLVVCMQLPEGVCAQQISCTLTRLSLSLTFTDAPECEARYTFNNAALYDEIMADESVWTLENGRLLTLYLQKNREGVRWPSVFSSDDGILETMDPNEFAVIRENMEKYTSDILDVTGRSAPMQSTAEIRDNDGPDPEQEDMSVVFSVRSWLTGQATDSSVAGSPDWLCSTFPLSAAEKSTMDTSNVSSPVCLKFDVDGIVFAFQSNLSDNSVRACHVGSFSALSYIQASKRDRRLMYIDQMMSVAVVTEAKRRVYIYHQTKNPKDTKAEQNIVEFGDSDILGIQISGHTLVVLCDNSVCLIDVDK